MEKQTNTNYIGSDEQIIWQAKPKKWPFIFDNVFGKSGFLFVLIWLLIDGSIIFTVTSMGSKMPLFFYAFFAIHLMPVWMWIRKIINIIPEWKKTEYSLTNRRVIFKTGTFLSDGINSLSYKEIANVTFQRTLTDMMFKTGDINIHTTNGSTVRILDVANYLDAYNLIQKTVIDIQNDIEFPNAYRPDTNPGYNTKYEPNKSNH